MKHTKALIDCPCGSGLAYTSCCQPLHNGQAAKSPEALMRSRYSAYVFVLEDYILATWHSSTRPDSLGLSQDNTKWLGLQVLREDITSPTTAIVEFVARYKVGGTRAERMHEISEFVYNDAWYYVTGQTN